MPPAFTRVRRIAGILGARRLVGRAVAGYQLVAILGHGRFGTCYRARPLHTDGPDLVFKLVVESPEPLSQREDAPTMATDGRSAGSRHCHRPNSRPRPQDAAHELLWAEAAAFSLAFDEHRRDTPEWLGVARDERGRTFLLQTLMEGRPLDRMLRDGTVFSPAEIHALIAQLMAILDRLHARGVLHNDVRPANILVDEGRLALIDFGMATFFDQRRCPEVFAADGVTDRSGVADVLLFLLYSDPKRVRRTKRGMWRDELDLDPSQRAFIDGMFAETPCGENWGAVRRQFDHLFRPATLS